jgi:hypothetical protein
MNYIYIVNQNTFILMLVIRKKKSVLKDYGIEKNTNIKNIH